MLKSQTISYFVRCLSSECFLGSFNCNSARWLQATEHNNHNICVVCSCSRVTYYMSANVLLCVCVSLVCGCVSCVGSSTKQRYAERMRFVAVLSPNASVALVEYSLMMKRESSMLSLARFMLCITSHGGTVALRICNIIYTTHNPPVIVVNRPNNIPEFDRHLKMYIYIFCDRRSSTLMLQFWHYQLPEKSNLSHNVSNISSPYTFPNAQHSVVRRILTGTEYHTVTPHIIPATGAISRPHNPKPFGVAAYRMFGQTFDDDAKSKRNICVREPVSAHHTHTHTMGLYAICATAASVEACNAFGGHIICMRARKRDKFASGALGVRATCATRI